MTFDIDNAIVEVYTSRKARQIISEYEYDSAIERHIFLSNSVSYENGISLKDFLNISNEELKKLAIEHGNLLNMKPNNLKNLKIYIPFNQGFTIDFAGFSNFSVYTDYSNMYFFLNASNSQGQNILSINNFIGYNKLNFRSSLGDNTVYMSNLKGSCLFDIQKSKGLNMLNANFSKGEIFFNAYKSTGTNIYNLAFSKGFNILNARNSKSKNILNTTYSEGINNIHEDLISKLFGRNKIIRKE